MARMGHASPRTALIYQHATSDRDQAIASALSNLAAEAELTRIAPRDGRADGGSLGRSPSTLETRTSRPKFPLIASARTPSHDHEQGFCALKAPVV